MAQTEPAQRLLPLQPSRMLSSNDALPLREAPGRRDEHAVLFLASLMATSISLLFIVADDGGSNAELLDASRQGVRAKLS